MSLSQLITLSGNTGFSVSLGKTNQSHPARRRCAGQCRVKNTAVSLSAWEFYFTRRLPEFILLLFKIHIIYMVYGAKKCKKNVKVNQQFFYLKTLHARNHCKHMYMYMCDDHALLMEIITIFDTKRKNRSKHTKLHIKFWVPQLWLHLHLARKGF